MTPISVNDCDSLQRYLVTLLADGRRVSGRELADHLGISRAAVWKRLARLRERGLDLSASAGSGYQLTCPLELLDADDIHGRMSALARHRIEQVDAFWELASTNALLMQRAHVGDRGIRAIVAEIQTAGRGRRGRPWRSAIGGSLVLSLSWQFSGGMNALAGLSVVAGIALVDALADCGITGVGLKWPNDAVVADRKLAGILVEIGGEAQGPCHAVIGIGVNVRVDAWTAGAIDQDWTDLAALCPPRTTISRNTLAAQVLSRLAEHLTRFERDGFSPFADAYARYDALRGREVRVIGGLAERHGTAVGIDARGTLRVSSPAGDFLVDSGEVSVRANETAG